MSRAENHMPVTVASPPRAVSPAAVVESLFRKHNQSLVKFLAARLSSHAEAKDVAQEAYVRLLQLHRPEAVDFLRAFLFRTASNIAIDNLRRRRIAQRAGFIESRHLDTDRLCPERRVSSLEEMVLVRRCLNELAPQCRRALVLSRIEGMRLQDIASELEVSTRTVKRYISEGLALIHRRMQGLDNSHPEE